MKIAVLGTGLMGYSISERLLDRGYDLMVYNRTRDKAEPLQSLGAKIAGTPAEAIGWAQCVIVAVTDAAAIDSVLFTDSVPNFAEKTVLQMATIAPEESKVICDRVTEAGGEYLEAPVLGNKHHAKSGELIIMVGSGEDEFHHWEEVFNALGKHVYHAGPVGTASALKLALNQLIASLTAGFGLSLQLVQRQGVSTELFMDLLRNSALYAPQFDKKLPRILKQDYSDPNFATRHLLKDINLMIKASQAEGLETAALEGVRKIVEQAIRKGFRETDYSSLVEGIPLKD
ncbi:MAG: NAD(P)-dependent oxidoreductase [Calditrichota bacterium]